MVSLILAAVALVSSSARAEAPVPLYSDLRDVVTYQHDPIAAAVVDNMEATPTRYFPTGVDFYKGGVRRFRPGEAKAIRNRSDCDLKTSDCTDAVYGVEFTAQPLDVGGGISRVQVQAFFHSKSVGDFVFRKYTLDVDGAARQVQTVTFYGADVKLSETHFALHTGLLQRESVLTDAEHGITKLYPLGVGGFDQVRFHGTRLMTPLYNNAFLDRSNVLAHR
ncbi:MAG TPA: hypothetical protein VL588_01390, partial [Bdellovibrionota bacterium]|nr:hypothetical protein [Bdellovibrionota bacterium]